MYLQKINKQKIKVSFLLASMTKVAGSESGYGHFSEGWICGSGSTPKSHKSGTLVEIFTANDKLA
jgi:hypothetical protein